MLKIKPVIVFGVNAFLMFVSWAFYRLPRADEYLILFMIPQLPGGRSLTVFMVFICYTDKRLLIVVNYQDSKGS